MISYGRNASKFFDRLFDKRAIPETLQNKFSKIILGVHSKSSNLAVKSELGILRLHISIYVKVISYFLRLLLMKDNDIILML